MCVCVRARVLNGKLSALSGETQAEEEEDESLH